MSFYEQVFSSEVEETKMKEHYFCALRHYQLDFILAVYPSFFSRFSYFFLVFSAPPVVVSVAPPVSAVVVVPVLPLEAATVPSLAKVAVLVVAVPPLDSKEPASDPAPPLLLTTAATS
jgi:hypothetical protein